MEWIAQDLEVTTLRYQGIDDMVKAIGLAKESLCLYCWTGICPGKQTGDRIQGTGYRVQRAVDSVKAEVV